MVAQQNSAKNPNALPVDRDKGLPNVWLLIAWALAMTAVGFFVFVLSR